MVIDLTKYAPSVYIDLSPGVYAFPAFTAEGKTYLSLTLRRLRTVERVDSNTYVDNFTPETFFDRSKRDLVMLDRYDLYYGQGLSEMKCFAENGGVVLLDCKSSLRNKDFCPCGIKFTEGGLVVYDTVFN